MIGRSPNSQTGEVTVTGNQYKGIELKTDEKNQARSANASDSGVASCTIPLELANIEPEDAKQLGIDRTLNPKTITLETFKKLSTEEKSQLTKIWTEQFIQLQELPMEKKVKTIPTTEHGFLCLDLNLLNKEGYDTFFETLKNNTSIVHLQLYNCKNLTDLKALQPLTNLQSVHLQGCQNLTNVEALESLTKLQSLNLQGCQKL